MIIPVAALIALTLPLLIGGRITHLASVRLRHVGWIVVALMVQILIVEILTGPQAVLAGAHIATYAVAAWFVFANRQIPGLAVIGLGAGLNALAITVNGGILPARPGALRAAGIEENQRGFVNSGALEHAHLSFLGDVFALPAPLPLANVFSVGDVLIITGTALASWAIMGTRWTRPWRPRLRRRPAHRAEATAR